MAFRSLRRGSCALLGLATSLLAQVALGQNAEFPADPAPPPAAAAPAPTPAPTPQPAPAPQPAALPQPGPAPAAAAPPPPVTAAQPAYAPDAQAQPGYGTSYGEPPPPPPSRPEEEKSSIPPFSVRIDPFTWILQGQLGVELEVGLLKWLSVETVPMFVTNETPPWLHLGGGDGRVYQHSGGPGPLAGASFGLNFWPRKLFDGYVIRTGFTNYGFEYETKDSAKKRFDFVSHTNRQFYAMLGSVGRWGAFTLAGGIGLAYDLNKESRCIPKTGVFDPDNAKPGDCDEIQIATPSGTNQVLIIPLTPFTYPWELIGRISLGVTID